MGGLPAPDYTTLLAFLGVGTAARVAARPTECRDALAVTATRSPVVLAFVTTSDCDSIYVAHSLSLYPSDFASPCALDGLLVGLVGDEPAVAFPVVLPQTFMTLTAVTAVHDVATLQGATVHGATPPVFHSGPHVTRDVVTTDIRAHRAMMLPSDLAVAALRNAPQDGRYTLLSFFNTFLQPWPLRAVPNIDYQSRYFLVLVLHTLAGSAAQERSQQSIKANMNPCLSFMNGSKAKPTSSQDTGETSTPLN
jgi:hypothetical protein